MFAAVESGTIDQEQLYQTIDEMLFANLDVTIGGMSWNPIFLAANPEYQERVRSEIQSVDCEDTKAVEAYLQCSTSMLAACIVESARLKPLAAFSVPQSATSDRIVGGYLIPAGTDFVVDAYALNIRDTAFWGNDTATYRPERFLEAKASKTSLRYHFWRFGFGPRQCMGKHVADMIIKQLLVFMLRRYELSLAGIEDQWAKKRESWITHPDFRIGCKTRCGSHIAFQYL